MDYKGVKMKGEWNEIKIVVPVNSQEPVASILYGMNVKGISIEDPTDLDKYEKSPLTWDYADINLFKEGKDSAVIKAYFPDTDNIKKHIEYITSKIEELRTFGFEIENYLVESTKVNEEDWATSWKKYYKPMRIGRNIIIKPIWEEYEGKPEDIIIKMDPGMAFGTGTHETTKMCIDALEDHVHGGEFVVDVGTGSGILGITSAKLGAEKVIAVDLDPVAVDSARINKGFNEISNMEVLEGNLLDVVTEKSDVVIANIIADVIIFLLKDIRRILKEDGIFIASGIINLRLDEVLEALKTEGLEVLEVRMENDWCCVVSRLNKKVD